MGDGIYQNLVKANCAGSFIGRRGRWDCKKRHRRPVRHSGGSFDLNRAGRKRIPWEYKAWVLKSNVDECS